jgi:hypothetical protein
VAGMCANVVTCENVELACAYLNAPATSLFVLQILAELCVSWAALLGHSVDSGNNSPWLALNALPKA